MVFYDFFLILYLVSSEMDVRRSIIIFVDFVIVGYERRKTEDEEDEV